MLVPSTKLAWAILAVEDLPRAAYFADPDGNVGRAR